MIDKQIFYLNDDITITTVLPIAESQNCNYQVEWFNKKDTIDGEGMGIWEWTPIYYGVAFAESDGEKAVLDLYLNDILMSFRNTDNVIQTSHNAVPSRTVYKPMNHGNYRVVIEYKAVDGTYQTKTDGQCVVMLYYRYPTLEDKLECRTIPSEYYGDTNIVQKQRDIVLVREGYDNTTGKSILIPRIPYMPSGIFAFGGTFIPSYEALAVLGNKMSLMVKNEGLRTIWSKDVKCTQPCMTSVTVNGILDSVVFDPRFHYWLYYSGFGNKMTETYVVIADSIQEGYAETLTDTKPLIDMLTEFTNDEDRSIEIVDAVLQNKEITIITTKDKELANRVYEKLFVGGVLDGYGIDTIETPIQEDIKLADIDTCPSRYYLMWEDRVGGLQCQPFDGRCIFSSTLKNNLIENQYRQRRLGNTTYTSKWKLNTKWLTDDEYMIYESILVSPYLTLIDTVNNIAFDVVSTANNYTEKTYKNQDRNLISFSLDVELNKTERILY